MAHYEIPTIKESDKYNFITSIWIVPIIALFIAGWLAYQYYSELGPQIKIIFPNNEGLKAGQSLVKYKDVPVGKVTQIHLEDDGESVAVYVRMDKTAKIYLNEHTKFWIVKPEVTMGGISGLDTLISGTYIDMYTREGEEYLSFFRGLPYTFREEREGEYFHLSAPTSYNIRQGTPIYFKNIEAGKVEYLNISLDGNNIDFYAFIESQFIPYVHTDSRFWVKSALDVDISNGRLDVNVAPITHLIQGGISFSSGGEDPSRKVPDKFVFQLFSNQSAAEQKRISRGDGLYRTFEVHVDHSIAKLKKGASVEFEGYDVGDVIGSTSYYNAASKSMNGIVYFQVDTSFFEDIKQKEMSGEQNFMRAIKQGIHASISPVDPISGSLYVDLVFADTNASVHDKKGARYTLIPSLPNYNIDLATRVELFITKMESLVTSADRVVQSSEAPLTATFREMNQTMYQLRTFTGQKEFQNLPKEFDTTLAQLDKTLKETEALAQEYRTDALITQQVSDMLRVLTETTEEMKKLLRLLNRKPDSFVFGDH